MEAEMNGEADSRNGSFSTGAMETKYPSIQLQPKPSFQPTSVFDRTQVMGSSNGLSGTDYQNRLMGVSNPNGASSQTFDQRLWIGRDRNLG